MIFSKSLGNNFGLVIILLFAISPLMGYFTYSYLNKDESPFLLFLCLGGLTLILLEKGNLKIIDELLKRDDIKVNLKNKWDNARHGE